MTLNRNQAIWASSKVRHAFRRLLDAVQDECRRTGADFTGLSVLVAYAEAGTDHATLCPRTILGCTCESCRNAVAHGLEMSARQVRRSVAEDYPASADAQVH